jgi:hypothetical protein
MGNENTIQLTLQIKEDRTVVIDQTSKKIKDLEGEIDKGNKSASLFGESLVAAAVKLGTLTAATYTAKKAFDFMEKGVKALQIEETFRKITQASDIMGGVLIENIKRVSGVFVDSTELMVMAQRALIEGLDPQEIIKLTEASRTAARMMGMAVKDSFNMIMESVISLRTRGLRPAFPEIKEETELFTKLANTLGVQADQLTITGQRQAVVNEILRQNAEVLKILGPLHQDEYEKMQQTRSAWALAYEDLSKMVSKAAEWAALDIAKGMKGIETRAVFKVQEELEGPPTKGGLVKPDPFKILYGQTEEEIKAGIGRAQKSYKEWMEGYVNETEVQYNRIEEVYEKVAPGVLKLKEILVTDWGVPKPSPESEAALKLLLQEEKYRDQVTEAINRQNKALEELGLGFEQPGEEYLLERLREEAALRQEIAGQRLEAERRINAEIERLGLGFEQPSEEYQIAHLVRPATEWENAWQNAVEGVANIWSSNFSIMRRSGEDFGDWFKGMWLDAADYAINQIWKISVNYALMGNMAGKYQAGAGILGMLGSLIGVGGSAAAGMAVAAQEGFYGWVNRPTLFLAGEAGRERVNITPEGKATPDIVNVIIENKTGLAIQKRETEITWDGKRWVKNVILELLVTDMDIRSSIKGLN